MRINDLILFLVIFGSAAVAVFFPDTGIIFQPYLLYFMMLLLFLSFLNIDFRALLDTSRESLLRLATMASVKLIVLPTALYAIALFVIPDYAVPILLLSGISTGVVAPFLASLVAADVATVLRMVIVTSLAVPFSLPCLVKLLAGAELSIPLDSMIRMLALVIFVPMGSVLVLRRIVPQALEKIAQRQYPVSLLMFAAGKSGGILEVLFLLLSASRADHGLLGRCIRPFGHLLLDRLSACSWTAGERKIGSGIEPGRYEQCTGDSLFVSLLWAAFSNSCSDVYVSVFHNDRAGQAYRAPRSMGGRET